MLIKRIYGDWLLDESNDYLVTEKLIDCSKIKINNNERTESKINLKNKNIKKINKKYMKNTYNNKIKEYDNKIKIKEYDNKKLTYYSNKKYELDKRAERLNEFNIK
jgi:hypothetical protein